MGTLSREQLRELYGHMFRTRSTEERLERLVRQGQVVGNLYRSLGQEATAVGSAYALGRGDWLCPGIRGLGSLFVRGVAPRDIFLQYLGRGARGTQGKDTTTHFTDPGLGILGPVSPLGDQLCVLNGIAMALERRGGDRVCVAYLGEGATRTGASHEGINFAAVRRLPMIVVLEHNRWAFSTPSRREAAVEDWSDVAAAYGLPVRSVDGNDVLDVYDASAEAAARARDGEGAAMIVAETYRMSGHAQHDPQPYVDPEELASWGERDPLRRFRDYLVDSGFEPVAALDDLEEEIKAEVEEAARTALGAPAPATEDARTRVYAEPPGEQGGRGAEAVASVPWTRRETVGYEDLPAGVRGWRPGGGDTGG